MSSAKAVVYSVSSTFHVANSSSFQRPIQSQRTLPQQTRRRAHQLRLHIDEKRETKEPLTPPSGAGVPQGLHGIYVVP